jgi:iron complex outermembrane receptor protein
MKSRLKPLVALLAACPLPGLATDIPLLDEIVVTAPHMRDPLTIVIDAKAPQQPVPANDGAAFLKTVPGFSMIRKGGTDGDPVLRGLAGSRLNIQMEGSELLGGCPMRMDPPTAYVFPETFDSVTVIKGPQSVAHGNGNLAGVVLFERDEDKAAQAGARANASLMAGSWGRLDALLGGSYAGEKAFIQANASHAEADDYQDGDGRDVHASYQRESLNTKLGWNIDRNTRLLLDAVASQAEAAYADRTMDGSQFDRDGYGITFTKKHLSPLVSKIEAQAYYNHVDHIMDNYSLRTPPLAMGQYSASAMDVDRVTKGARLSTELDLGSDDLLKLGLDWQTNVHSGRMGMAMNANAATAAAAATASYLSKPKLEDVETDITGAYGEWKHFLGDRARLIGGLRFDQWNADRFNNAVNPVVLVRSASEDLNSAFLRYERELKNRPATFFIGLGHASRPMDYWEMKTYNGLSTTLATPQLKPESNSQLDTGLVWKTAELSASASLFYSKIDDYLLTYSGTTIGQCDPSIVASSGRFNCGFNVDATRYGGEADLAWRFTPGWTLRSALAYVHADNDTMRTPLAQTPPLETRLGLEYSTGAWAFGSVLRMVDRQDRVHIGYGNIVGQDIGTTPGFATLALNASYKPSKKVMLTAGIDNVFDKTYAEHLSRGDTVDSGLPANSRIFEPGRFFWAKISASFD